MPAGECWDVCWDLSREAAIGARSHAETRLRVRAAAVESAAVFACTRCVLRPCGRRRAARHHGAQTPTATQHSATCCCAVCHSSRGHQDGLLHLLHTAHSARMCSRSGPSRCRTQHGITQSCSCRCALALLIGPHHGLPCAVQCRAWLDMRVAEMWARHSALRGRL